MWFQFNFRPSPFTCFMQILPHLSCPFQHFSCFLSFEEIWVLWGGDRIPVELSKIQKMMLLKCCITMSANLENPAVTTGLDKVNLHPNWITHPKKGRTKECSNYWTIALLSLVAQWAKHLPTMQKTQVWSLGREDPLEKDMATHSSTPAWKIPWTEDNFAGIEF